jgi:hypothetical protein
MQIKEEVMRGPIDFIIVRFDGNKFDGSILRALSDALDKKIINMLALVLIRKDSDGELSFMDFAEGHDKFVMEFAKKYPGDSRLVRQDDVDEIAELLEPDTAAGLLVVEHLWAVPFKRAVTNAGGILVADGRIHPEVAQELTKV